ncbi:MAG TPA: ADP-ribosylglycohydrolase family protein [Tepidisphaeraceae bacterium]
MPSIPSPSLLNRFRGCLIALAMREPVFDPAAFFAELQRQAATEEFADALAQAAGLISSGEIGLLGTSLEANRSVTTALACFASHPDSYPDAVSRAIGLGGDTDTLAAMVGALSGARLGVQAIPAHLLAMLEDGPNGRSHIDNVAHRLHAVWEQSKAGPQGTIP